MVKTTNEESNKKPVVANSTDNAGTGTATTPALLRLSNEILNHVPPTVQCFRYDRKRVTPGIVHIGVGNFFRAHLAMYVEKCLHIPGQEEWGIVGIGIRQGQASAKKAEKVQSQNGLYTLSEYSPNGGVSTRIVGSMIRYMHAPSDPQAALDLVASPAIRIISLTITEGGYNIDEKTKEFVLADEDVQHDLANPTTPKSVFGLIVEALSLRRSKGLPGLTILSCDNLRSNGDVSRKAFLGFAHARDPELATWIGENVSFPNSMVDRIAPAVGDAAAARVNSHSGIMDETPVITESFSQWVVEDKFIAGRPSFHQVGVELRSDVAKFEVIKQRLLNGSHSMLAYPALICGFRMVDEALRDKTVVAYLTAFMKHDVIRFVGEISPEGLDLDAYTASIIERFTNPAIGDQLIRIAFNGCVKFPVYLSNTFSTLLTKGAALERAALLAVSFEQYLKGSDLKGGRFIPDEPHLTEEDKEILASGEPYSVLKTSAFATFNLAENEKFRQKFDEARNRMTTEGPDAALAFAAAAETLMGIA
ncbi:hypothetical protein R1sor_004345 [Riccia sorocarpa]|uniref:mannitol 2-dehydrogenase n=1 Tax=Riccia sorocarpa TaxID=122646 RepID=A0ABD3HMR9_9MARC